MQTWISVQGCHVLPCSCGLWGSPPLSGWLQIGTVHLDAADGCASTCLRCYWVCLTGLVQGWTIDKHYTSVHPLSNTNLITWNGDDRKWCGRRQRDAEIGARWCKEIKVHLICSYYGPTTILCVSIIFCKLCCIILYNNVFRFTW